MKLFIYSILITLSLFSYSADWKCTASSGVDCQTVRTPKPGTTKGPWVDARGVAVSPDPSGMSASDYAQAILGGKCPSDDSIKWGWGEWCEFWTADKYDQAYGNPPRQPDGYEYLYFVTGNKTGIGRANMMRRSITQGPGQCDSDFVLEPDGLCYLQQTRCNATPGVTLILDHGLIIGANSSTPQVCAQNGCAATEDSWRASKDILPAAPTGSMVGVATPISSGTAKASGSSCSYPAGWTSDGKHYSGDASATSGGADQPQPRDPSSQSDCPSGYTYSTTFTTGVGKCVRDTVLCPDGKMVNNVCQVTSTNNNNGSSSGGTNTTPGTGNTTPGTGTTTPGNTTDPGSTTTPSNGSNNGAGNLTPGNSTTPGSGTSTNGGTSNNGAGNLTPGNSTTPGTGSGTSSGGSSTGAAGLGSNASSTAPKAKGSCDPSSANCAACGGTNEPACAIDDSSFEGKLEVVKAAGENLLSQFGEFSGKITGVTDPTAKLGWDINLLPRPRHDIECVPVSYQFFGQTINLDFCKFQPLMAEAMGYFLYIMTAISLVYAFLNSSPADSKGS